MGARDSSGARRTVGWCIAWCAALGCALLLASTASAAWWRIQRLPQWVSTDSVHDPQLAVDARGDAIAVWQSGGSLYAAYRQAGKRFGSIRRLVRDAVEFSLAPSLQDGRGLLAWSAGAQPGPTHVYAATLRNGRLAGRSGRLALPGETFAVEPSAALGPNGREAVVWSSGAQPYTRQQTLAARVAGAFSRGPDHAFGHSQGLSPAYPPDLSHSATEPLLSPKVAFVGTKAFAVWQAASGSSVCCNELDWAMAGGGAFSAARVEAATTGLPGLLGVWAVGGRPVTGWDNNQKISIDVLGAGRPSQVRGFGQPTSSSIAASPLGLLLGEGPGNPVPRGNSCPQARPMAVWWTPRKGFGTPFALGPAANEIMGLALTSSPRGGSTAIWNALTGEQLTEGGAGGISCAGGQAAERTVDLSGLAAHAGPSRSLGVGLSPEAAAASSQSATVAFWFSGDASGREQPVVAVRALTTPMRSESDLPVGGDEPAAINRFVHHFTITAAGDDTRPLPRGPLAGGAECGRRS